MTPVDVNRQFVLTKCDYFVDVQLWPLRSKLDPEAWLTNFSESELDHALCMLNAFIYYSQPVIDRMFQTAFQNLSLRLRRAGESFLSTKAAWNSFLDNVLITRVTGETPNDTDSGFHFVRMARQLLGIPEDRILGTEDALQELHDGGPRPVVFVDDFVGSGEQFLHTWKRMVQLRGAIPMSFERIAHMVRGTEFFYVPLLCTAFGQEEILKQCSQITICPAHFLPKMYSALAPDSILWPDHLRASAFSFLHQASCRAGIPEYKWRGYRDLALSLAFDHGVPDATLPIFYWNQNGWKPLIERK